MADIIKVEHLSYIYNPGMPNAVTALDDVSFTVEEGDFVGIIGATGSGKSTLITHMNGLNKPTSGKIYIDGRDLWAEPEKIRDFRFLTGLVFQYPEYQLFEETCYKDIAFGPKNMGLDEAEIDKRVHEAAAFVGLDEALLERSPFELSGGQKRRVAVAGVMAMKPRILVLDEPAAGLDPEGRDEILSEVKEYHKKTGTTVLLVSHSMEDIAKYANRVLVMSNKKIAMYDTVENVFARASELLALGLSVPQVTKIFLKLREMGVDVPADVYTIPYAVKTILAAKARRDAGEPLVLPRDAENGKGGVTGRRETKKEAQGMVSADEKVYLVDLPGYGYAKVSQNEKQKWGKMIEDYLHKSSQLKAVFLLIDIRHDPSANDKQMYDWVLHNGFSPIIIATKLDKIKRSQVQKQVKAIKQGLQVEKGTRVIPFSAETKQGREEIWSVIEGFLDAE